MSPQWERRRAPRSCGVQTKLSLSVWEGRTSVSWFLVADPYPKQALGYGILRQLIRSLYVS